MTKVFVHNTKDFVHRNDKSNFLYLQWI